MSAGNPARPLRRAAIAKVLTSIAMIVGIAAAMGAPASAYVPAPPPATFNPPFPDPPVCFKTSQYSVIACDSLTPKAPGCYALNLQGRWIQIQCLAHLQVQSPPPRATGAPTDNVTASDACKKNPALCATVPNCVPDKTASGNGVWTSTGVTADKPSPQNCKPPGTAGPAGTTKPVGLPPHPTAQFCTQHPGVCVPPKGKPFEFCERFPEQCYLPDAAKPQTGNPYASPGGP